MSIPRYQEGETVRVLVEGTVVHHAPCESPYPSELTVAVPLEGGGTYDVTVPLGAATIERLAPTVLPREIWGDRDGDPWFAICVLGFDTPRTMMLPGELHDLKGVGDSMLSPEDVNRRYGPITRVYPPAPAADTTSGQAEETSPGQADEPRLMLDDLWGDRDGAGWKVVGDRSRLGLACVRGDGLVLTRAEVTRNWGPLTLIERAGYHPTGGTVPTERLTIGMVVSSPDWVGGAPVRLTAPADGTERAYELLGDGETGVGTAGPGALFTVWEPAGGAR